MRDFPVPQHDNTARARIGIRYRQVQGDLHGRRMDQRKTGDWIKIAKLRSAPGYACATVLERLQAILQGCRLRMNPRKSHPHTYPQLLALDTPKAASLDAYGGGIRHSLEKIG